MFYEGQTVFQALGACFHAPFVAWKRIPFEPVLSHLCHIPSRYPSANVHRHFVTLKMIAACVSWAEARDHLGVL